MAGSVEVERNPGGLPGVLVVTLKHPGKFNAMSRRMWAELKTVFGAAHQDSSLRCVVVQGDAGHFCSGGDIAEYPAFRFDESQLRHFHEREVWGALQAMLDCEVPIIARIEGNCMGAGMEIASCCDVRLAADTARFGAPIAKLGFPMAPREAALVGQVAGATVARAMLLGAEVFDAAAMLAHGFLTRVHTCQDLQAQCMQWLTRMVTLAPQAARLNKRTLRALNGGLAHEKYETFATDFVAKNFPDAYAYASTREHREGITAFLEKRPPVF